MKMMISCEAAFTNGASGYVVKARIATDLVAAVTEVLAGRTFVSSFSNFGNGTYRPDGGDTLVTARPRGGK